MGIAQNIRYLRKKQGWGQDTLAEKLGYKSYTTIQKWESGVSEPPLKVVHELAALFHVDINDIVSSDIEFNDTVRLLGQKEQPLVTKELSEAKRAMYEFVDGLSDEQVHRLLQIARAAFEK